MLKGLAWGHRRAVDPLAPLQQAFADAGGEADIHWTIRRLADFEHQPLEEVATRYDFVIVDHPFCGEIAASRAFLPLEESIPDLLGEQADARYVGPTLKSYRFEGHVWAAPIDAASVNAVARADLLAAGDEKVPRSWQETVELGQRLRRKAKYLALPFRSPHAYCALASLMANLGEPVCLDSVEEFAFSEAAARTALDAIDAVLACSPHESLGWNAIDLHEAMVARDDIAFCPAVFGYATYAEADMRARLRFHDFCGLREPFAAGSMIGGTGLAVSAATQYRDAAVSFARFCLGRHAQDVVIPANHGQPALASAWLDPDNNRRFGNYFSSVRQSMNASWIRPRVRGYIGFQDTAGKVIEAYCRRDIDRQKTVHSLVEAARALVNGSGPLSAVRARG